MTIHDSSLEAGAPGINAYPWCPNYADGARPSHAAGATGSPRQRNWKFESIPLQYRVHCEPDADDNAASGVRGRVDGGDRTRKEIAAVRHDDVAGDVSFGTDPQRSLAAAGTAALPAARHRDLRARASSRRRRGPG